MRNLKLAFIAYTLQKYPDCNFTAARN